MSFRTARNLVLITCLSVLGSGCSFAFVKGPPSGHESLQDFSCTEGRTVPVLDATWAGLGAVVLVAALAEDPNSGSGDAIKSISTIVGGGSLALWGLSALVGVDRVDRCRAAKAELARRSQEAAERARLITPGS